MNKPDTWRWNDALLAAAENGLPRQVAEALAQGADPNATNELGATALHKAASWGFIEVAQVLLDHGADPMVGAQLGTTPLHYAASRDNEEMVRLLLARGAMVNVRNHKGVTPLHYAAMDGREANVALLLAHGARVDIKSGVGKTPLLALLDRDADHAALGRVAITLMGEMGLDTRAPYEGKTLSEWFAQRPAALQAVRQHLAARMLEEISANLGDLDEAPCAVTAPKKGLVL